MLVVTTPTGQIGRHVLAQLVAAGEPVRAVARDRTRIEPGALAKAEVVEGSIDDPATLGKALDGAEAVFWCIPPAPGCPTSGDITWASQGRSPPPWRVRRSVGSSSSRAAGVGVRRMLGPSPSRSRSRSFSRGPGCICGPCGAGFHGEHAPSDRAAPASGDVLLSHRWRHRQYPSVPPVISGRGPLISSATGRGRARPGPASTARPTCRFNEMAGVMSKVLGRPIRYQEVPGPAYKATLVEHGQSEAFAQGLVDMFREIAEGIHAADRGRPNRRLRPRSRHGAVIPSSPRSGDEPPSTSGGRTQVFAAGRRSSDTTVEQLRGHLASPLDLRAEICVGGNWCGFILARRNGSTWRAWHGDSERPGSFCLSRSTARSAAGPPAIGPACIARSRPAGPSPATAVMPGRGRGLDMIE